MGAFDLKADRAGDPLDEAEEGGAGRLGTFKEFELRRGDRLDSAQLRGGGAEFPVEDDVPAIAWVGNAGGIGGAGTLRVGADFGGERSQAIREGVGVERAEVVGGCGEGAGFFVNAGEEDAAFGRGEFGGRAEFLERGAFEGGRFGGDRAFGERGRDREGEFGRGEITAVGVGGAEIGEAEAGCEQRQQKETEQREA